MQLQMNDFIHFWVYRPIGPMLQLMRYQYLFPECSFSLRPFSFSDRAATVFRVGKHMSRMVLLVAEPVWPFSSYASVYAFAICDWFCNTRQVRPYSFVPMNLIHCLIQNILKMWNTWKNNKRKKYLYLLLSSTSKYIVCKNHFLKRKIVFKGHPLFEHFQFKKEKKCTMQNNRLKVKIEERNHWKRKTNSKIKMCKNNIEQRKTRAKSRTHASQTKSDATKSKQNEKV